MSRHQPIPEDDEFDIGLLSSVAKMASGGTAYKSIQVHPEEGEDGTAMAESEAFDLSSFKGPFKSPIDPSSPQANEHYQRLEAEGVLTGGLGVGVKPEARVLSKDLFEAAASPTSPINRGLSRRNTLLSRAKSRAPTLKDLAQNEANKRNEILEVVVEDGEDIVDISSYAGESTGYGNVSFGGESRQSTMKSASRVEVYYPQPNWKPFSMRWPYLTSLMLVSVLFACVQEYLLQKSLNSGSLYTFMSPQQLSTWDFFSFKYLPTILAVAYGVFWQLTDFEVKRLEAYYQLAQEGGALAAESLGVDYLTYFSFFCPIKALRYKHYTVAVSSLATLLAVSLTPTLQSASIVLTPGRNERYASPEALKEIRVSTAWSRLLSSVLVINAVLACLLLWLIHRRRSGLTADVKGVAGIAAMANRSHILMDFKNMDTATPKAIHQKLKGHRYMLRNSSLIEIESAPVSRRELDKYDHYRVATNPHPLMLRLVAGVPFIAGMILFLIFLPIVLFTPADIITEQAAWFLTALAVIIKLIFGTLENEVRMMEPFYKLSCRHQPPQVLTLDYTSMAFGWMPIRAFLNGDMPMALVGAGSVLAEIFTVSVTSFSGVAGNDFIRGNWTTSHDAGEETFHSFWWSFSLSMIILVYLCTITTFVYKLRRHPFLPRQPNTIASVLAFIHQSNMLYDFVGTEKLENDVMVRTLAQIGKTYGLGWFCGRDGEVHCGVDQEELNSGYKHGADARKAVKPWATNWEHY